MSQEQSPSSSEAPANKDFNGTPDNCRQITDYERRNLRLQVVGLIVQGIALFGAIGSIWLLYAQVVEQTKATKAQYDLLYASINQDLMSKQLEVDKLFIEKPQLYGYVFSKRRLPKEKIPPDALNAAYYHLDFFQLVYSQRSRLPTFQDENNDDWITWRNTMAGTFKESPLICDQLSELKNMYGKDFVSYVFDEHDWCKH